MVKSAVIAGLFKPFFISLACNSAASYGDLLLHWPWLVCNVARHHAVNQCKAMKTEEKK